MKKIKELKDPIIDSKDAIAIQKIDDLIIELNNLKIRIDNDPVIIESRKEYEIRKANGEFSDET